MALSMQRFLGFDVKIGGFGILWVGGESTCL